MRPVLILVAFQFGTLGTSFHLAIEAHELEHENESHAAIDHDPVELTTQDPSSDFAILDRSTIAIAFLEPPLERAPADIKLRPPRSSAPHTASDPRAPPAA